MKSLIKDVIKEMRPHQWYKNLLVFTALVFSGNIFEFSLYPVAIMAFFSFCLVSSATYVVNDILDVSKDRKHPDKKDRPVASGRISMKIASFLAAVLYISGCTLGLYTGILTFLVALLYIFTTLAYTVRLKNIVIVDVVTISLGFVYRAAAGAYAIKVPISTWLFMLAFLLALFLAIAKRRHELVVMKEESKNTRLILKSYSLQLLDTMLSVTAGTIILSYGIYTTQSDIPYLVVTMPLIVIGIFRYFQMVYVHEFKGEADMIFTDPLMIITGTLWIILIIVIFSGFPDAIFDYLGVRP